jgi:hypothetical protein
MAETHVFILVVNYFFIIPFHFQSVPVLPANCVKAIVSSLLKMKYCNAIKLAIIQHRTSTTSVLSVILPENWSNSFDLICL